MATNAGQDNTSPMEARIARPFPGRLSPTTLGNLLLNHIAPEWELSSPISKLMDPIFICVDCEAYWRDQSQITEVGVAILDSRDVKDIVRDHKAKALPPDGTPNHESLFKDIVSKIKHAHYRPVEYSDLKNRGRVQGCEDYFNFGTSTWIRLDDAPEVLRHVFEDPANLDAAADFSVERGVPEERNVVLVGHDVRGDVEYLRALGFNTRTVAIAVKFDTQRQCHDYQLALAKLLVAMDILAINLHNGGNDAAYTLMAMVKMVLFELERGGSVKGRTKAITYKPEPVTDFRVKAPVAWGGTAKPEGGTIGDTDGVKEGGTLDRERV